MTGVQKLALPRRFVLLSLVCLTASGTAGLIAEVVWSRVLAAMFGSALTGTGLLLSIFMTGLGVGSAIGGRIARRGIAPLAAFGIVEMSIGALVFATPALFRAAAPATIRMETHLTDAMAPLAPALTSILILGPIVVLMGMTFPLFLGGIAGGWESARSDAGWVYGINTFGAVAGTLIAGFWLLPALGIQKSLFLAGSIDLSVGVSCVAIGLRRSAISAFPTAASAVPWRPQVRRALTIAALGGAAALILEVAWFRVLMSIVGSSVYAISLMLAAFLLGLSSGAILGSPRIGRAASLGATLSRLHAQIAFTATLVTFLLQLVPIGYIVLLKEAGRSFAAVSAGTSILLVVTLIVPTFLMGMALPVAIAWGGSDDERETVTAAGRIYAGSSLGSAAGAFVAGFLLVPWWGVRGTAASAALLSISAAFVALRADASREARRTVMTLAAATAVVWAVWFGGLLPWNWRVLTGGHYAYAHLYTGATVEADGPMKRRASIAGTFAFVDEPQAPEPLRSETASEARLLSWRDGRYAQVAVTEEDGVRTLLLNGKADASTARADMRTQLLLGDLPILLAPDSPAGTAMVIGLGSGVTAGAVASWPFQTIVAAEIEPEVVRAAQFFRDENRDVLSDPRVRMRVDDGRRILARTSEPVALLTSEPSNLWMSGVSLLFTREFFELAAERLGERGVFCQWLHLYQIGEGDVKTFMATLTSVFPHIIVFSDEADLLIVASRQPLVLDPVVWHDRLAGNDAARRTLADAGIRSAEDIANGILADERAMRKWSAGARPHTDDRPLLEFSAARNMSFDRSRKILSSLVRAGTGAGPIALGTSGRIE